MVSGVRTIAGPPPEGAGLVLQLLREQRAATVSELAAAAGVARSTVLQRLEPLLRLGLVAAEERTVGARGRPAAVLEFRPRSGVVLAAHVGLTGTRTAVLDLSGTLVADRFVDFDVAGGPRALVSVLHRSFDELLADPGVPTDRVVGIGIGTPSGFELRSYVPGREVASADWGPVFLSRSVGEKYGVPVVVDLDVNCLAIAEHRATAQGAEVLVCVKLGTLISAAVVVRGVPVRGAGLLAGELGHIKVVGTDEPCSCGSRGCLDAVASGRALVRQLAEAGHPVAHVSEVVALADAGVPAAAQAIRTAGRRIGEVLASVVNLLNPAVISVWGYLTESESLLAGVREVLYSDALPASSERLVLSSTTAGRWAGLNGAALAVIDEVLAPAAVDRALGSGAWEHAVRTG